MEKHMNRRRRHTIAFVSMISATSMICCGLAAAMPNAAIAEDAGAIISSQSADAAQTDGVQSITATHDPAIDEHAFDAPAVASAETETSEERSSSKSESSTTNQNRPQQPQTLVTSASLPGERGLSSVAVTWNQPDDNAASSQPVVKLRYQDNGKWSDWTQAETQIAAPTDANEQSASATNTQGTDPVYVGTATAVEASVTLPDGSDVTDVNLVTIDSGYTANESTDSANADDKSDEQPKGSHTNNNANADNGSGTDNSAGNTGSNNSGDATGKHDSDTSDGTDEGTLDINIPIHTREQWWRKGLPAPFWPADDSGHWRGAVVHHTVDRNDYSQAEAKVIVQNIYTFHTKTRGWGDIGYNLLVDRFGGVWEGREEGVAHKAVLGSNAIGAHTGSFNEATFGVAVIGSFHENDKPSEASVKAVASVIAKEFKAMNVMTAHDTFIWHGRQNRISGHGDSSHWYDKRNRTLCPGKQLRARMNDIRDMVDTLLKASMPKNSAPIYRLYGPSIKLHHYTADSYEREVLISRGWQDEGIVFYAAKDGEPVYRLYNPKDHNHLYTRNTAERDHLAKRGWKAEGTAWNTTADGPKPVYRLYNRTNHEHLYTTSAKEYQTLGKKGWQQEHIAWNGL